MMARSRVLRPRSAGTSTSVNDKAKREGAELPEDVKEAAKPDQEGVGEAVGDALRPPDFRTKTSSPSTSEKRLTHDELPDPDEGSQG